MAMGGVREASDVRRELAFLDATVHKWREELARLRGQRDELERAAAAGEEDAHAKLRAHTIVRQKLIWSIREAEHDMIQLRKQEKVEYAAELLQKHDAAVGAAEADVEQSHIMGHAYEDDQVDTDEGRLSTVPEEGSSQESSPTTGRRSWTLAGPCNEIEHADVHAAAIGANERERDGLLGRRVRFVGSPWGGARKGVSYGEARHLSLLEGDVAGAPSSATLWLAEGVEEEAAEGMGGVPLVRVVLPLPSLLASPNPLSPATIPEASRLLAIATSAAVIGEAGREDEAKWKPQRAGPEAMRAVDELGRRQFSPLEGTSSDQARSIELRLSRLEAALAQSGVSPSQTPPAANGDDGKGLGGLPERIEARLARLELLMLQEEAMSHDTRVSVQGPSGNDAQLGASRDAVQSGISMLAREEKEGETSRNGALSSTRSPLRSGGECSSSHSPPFAPSNGEDCSKVWVPLSVTSDRSQSGCARSPELENNGGTDQPTLRKGAGQVREFGVQSCAKTVQALAAPASSMNPPLETGSPDRVGWSTQELPANPLLTPREQLSRRSTPPRSDDSDRTLIGSSGSRTSRAKARFATSSSGKQSHPLTGISDLKALGYNEPSDGHALTDPQQQAKCRNPSCQETLRNTHRELQTARYEISLLQSHLRTTRLQCESLQSSLSQREKELESAHSQLILHMKQSGVLLGQMAALVPSI